MIQNLSKEDIAEMLSTFGTLHAHLMHVTSDQISDEIAAKFNDAYIKICTANASFYPYADDESDINSGNTPYTEFTNLCDATVKELPATANELMSGGYMEPSEFMGHLVDMGEYSDGVDENKKLNETSESDENYLGDDKFELYNKVFTVKSFDTDDETNDWLASDEGDGWGVLGEKDGKIYVARLDDKGKQLPKINEDVDPSLLPFFYKGTQDDLEADIKKLHGDDIKIQKDGTAITYYDHDGDQVLGKFNPNGRNIIYKIPSKANENASHPKIADMKIGQKIIFMSVPYYIIGKTDVTIDLGKDKDSSKPEFSINQGQIDERGIFINESKNVNESKNIKKSHITEAADNNIIDSGTCICTDEPMSKNGLEGYMTGEPYKYEHMASDKNGKPYYRIYNTETDYDTCGTATFGKFFKQQDNANEATYDNVASSDIEVKYDEPSKCYNILPISDAGKKWYTSTYGVLSKYGKMIGSMDTLSHTIDAALKNGLTVDTLKDTFPKQANEDVSRDMDGNIIEPMDSVTVTDPALIEIPVDAIYTAYLIPDNSESIIISTFSSSFEVPSKSVKICVKANETKVTRPSTQLKRKFSYLFDAKRHASDNGIPYEDGLPINVIFEEMDFASNFKFVVGDGSNVGRQATFEAADVKKYIYRIPVRANEADEPAGQEFVGKTVRKKSTTGGRDTDYLVTDYSTDYGYLLQGLNGADDCTATSRDLIGDVKQYYVVNEDAGDKIIKIKFTSGTMKKDNPNDTDSYYTLCLYDADGKRVYTSTETRDSASVIMNKHDNIKMVKEDIDYAKAQQDAEKMLKNPSDYGAAIRAIGKRKRNPNDDTLEKLLKDKNDVGAFMSHLEKARTKTE